MTAFSRTAVSPPQTALLWMLRAWDALAEDWGRGTFPALLSQAYLIDHGLEVTTASRVRGGCLFLGITQEPDERLDVDVVRPLLQQETRKVAMSKLWQTRYARKIVALSQRAGVTRAQVGRAFADEYHLSTAGISKALTFYTTGAAYAGVPLAQSLLDAGARHRHDAASAQPLSPEANGHASMPANGRIDRMPTDLVEVSRVDTRPQVAQLATSQQVNGLTRTSGTGKGGQISIEVGPTSFTVTANVFALSTADRNKLFEFFEWAQRHNEQLEEPDD